MANNVSYLIELRDKFSAVADKAARRFDKLRTKAGNAANSVKRFSRSMLDAARSAGKMKAESVAALGAFAVSLGFFAKKVVDQSVAVEDAMADIGRVTDGSAADLLNFEHRLESMSEKLGKSKIGLAQMAFEGGKLGVALGDMEPFLMMVSKTAIAFDMADAEAGRAIGSIQAKMGLMREDTQKLLDSVNFLADTTTASGERMINVLERTAGTMSLLKVPTDAAASFAGFADQLEVTSELAASGLNMFFARLQRMPGMTTKLMTDPLNTVRDVLEKISAMGPEVQSEFIRKAFGDEAGRFVKKMVANVALFDKTVESAFSLQAVGSMNRELENQLSRSSKAFQKFSETTTNTLESIGDALKPMFASIASSLTPIINGIGEFVKQNPKIAQVAAIFVTTTLAVTGLAAAVGLLALAFGAISLPVLLVVGAIVAVITAVGALAVYWDDVVAGMKTAFEGFVNFVIDWANALVKPISLISDFVGLGKIQIPEFKFESPQAPTVAGPSASKSQANVEVTVKAEGGSKVTQTRSSVQGGGLNLGMNMQ